VRPCHTERRDRRRVGSPGHFKEELLMMRKHPSPALVVALIALFVALGGTSYAAINSLPNNSVGTPQLKNWAVTSPKISPGAVTASKINASASLHPTIYALVNADGAVDASQSRGITSPMVFARPGDYCFSGLPFPPKGGSVTVVGDAESGAGTTGYLTISDSAQLPDCGTGQSVEVVTERVGDSVPQAEPFYIVLYG
jgi:hypothetical protein